MTFSNFRLSEKGSIHSAPVNGYTLQMQLSGRGQVVAFLVHRVRSQQWVTDEIPTLAKKSKENLYAYLKDAYVRVVPIGEQDRKIYIHHRLRGGMPPRVGSAERINLGEVRDVIRYAGKAKDKDVIAFLGNTGVGKSTIVNHMLGVSLMQREERGLKTIVSTDPAKELATIGHSLTRSQTLFTHVYPMGSQDAQNNQVIADCGGFLDTRQEESMIVPLSILYTLQNARSVKFVLCVQYGSIDDTKGVCFAEQIKTICERLVTSEYREHMLNNLLILVTKGNTHTVEEVKEKIQEQIDELDPRHPLTVFYRKLLEGNKIQIYDPTSEASRSRAIAYLNSVAPIGETRNAFRVPYSMNTEDAIIDELSLISKCTRQSYDEYSKTESECKHMQSQIAREQEEVEKVRLIIEELEKGTIAPRETIQQTLLAHKNDAKQLMDSLEIVRKRLTQSQIAYSAHETQGETEIRYTTLPVDKDNPDVVLKGRPVWKIKWAYFLPFFQEGEAPIIGYRQTLSYQDQPIARVTHYPERSSECWKNEVLDVDQGTYTIEYDGKNSLARVDVYVKRKYAPGYEARLAQLGDEFAKLQQEEETLSSKLNIANKLIEESEKSINRLKDQHSQLMYFANEKISLLRMIQSCEGQLRVLNLCKDQARNKLRENQDRIEFLHEFLSLCSDELRECELFVEFEKFYMNYKQIINEAIA